jgi:hypothetical protein
LNHFLSVPAPSLSCGKVFQRLDPKESSGAKEPMTTELANTTPAMSIAKNCVSTLGVARGTGQHDRCSTHHTAQCSRPQDFVPSRPRRNGNSFHGFLQLTVLSTEDTVQQQLPLDSRSPSATTNGTFCLCSSSSSSSSSWSLVSAALVQTKEIHGGKAM